MTNDLAIRILTGDVLGTTEQTHEAVAMAVKALSALPSAQPDVPDTNVGDMISRQAAIMAVLYGSLGATTIYGRTEQGMTAQKETVQAIRMLPSAERHGKWIHDGYDFPHGVDWMHCSECGKRNVYCPATRTNFCPNCGARMDGE